MPVTSKPPSITTSSWTETLPSEAPPLPRVIPKSSPLQRLKNFISLFLVPTPQSACIGGAVGWYVHRYVETYGPGLVAQQMSSKIQGVFGLALQEETASSIGNLLGHLSAPFVVPEINPWAATMSGAAAAMVTSFLVNVIIKSRNEEHVEPIALPKSPPMTTRTIKTTRSVRRVPVPRENRSTRCSSVGSRKKTGEAVSRILSRSA